MHESSNKNNIEPQCCAVINRTVGWSGQSRVLSWIKHSSWPIRIKDSN